MTSTLSPDLRFKLSIGVPLLLIAFSAWYLSAFELQTMSMVTMPASAASTLPINTMADMFMSPTVPVVTSFLIVWVVGMAAMMFPAMIPVMSIYSEVVTKQERRPRLLRAVGTPLFLSGYLAAYALLGTGLFAAVYAAFQLASTLPTLSSLSSYGLAAVLLFAGVWQLTPLKEKSLSNCISPLGFFVTRAKSGLSGAFEMGAEHGYYCVACCWLYMLVMLAVAAMSLLSMVLLSGLIIVEKAFIGNSRWFKYFSASIFLFLAMAVFIVPSYLSFL